MKEVRVTKASLLSKLKENRIAHKIEYEEMMKVYHEKVIKGLENLLSNAKLKPAEYITSLNFNQPTSYIKDYDIVIGMLQMSEDDEFVISQNEYRKYVLNEWEWSGHFDMLKTMYVS